MSQAYMSIIKLLFEVLTLSLLVFMFFYAEDFSVNF